jgi:hypothetical protein
MCETLLSPTIRRASYSARLPEFCPAHAYITIADITHTIRFSLSLTPDKLQVASLLQARVAYHWTDNCFPSSTVGSSCGDQAPAWSCLQLLLSQASKSSTTMYGSLSDRFSNRSHYPRIHRTRGSLRGYIVDLCRNSRLREEVSHRPVGPPPLMLWACGRAKRLGAVRREPSAEHSTTSTLQV